jgi:hypothetical protein
MLNKLIQYMDNKKLISIYTNNSVDDFSLGFIDTMDKDFIRMRILSNDGIYLGYEIIKVDSISRIDEDSIYDKKVEFLSNNFKGKYSEVTLKSNNDEDTVVIDLLKESKNKKLVLSLSLSEDILNDIIGIIYNISDNLISILSLDDYGKEIEKVNINVQDIFSISCGDKKLQIIQFLRENNFSTSNFRD